MQIEGNQLDLFNPKDSKYQRFKKFHEEYPQVYRLFTKFCFQLIERGWKKFGGRMIIERIRWEIATGSKDDEGFKINNNTICYYSRLFMSDNPEYNGYIPTREITTP